MKEPSNYPSSYNDPRHERHDIDFSQEDAGQQEPERIHEDYYPRDDYSSRPRQHYRPRPDRDDYRDDYREPARDDYRDDYREPARDDYRDDYRERDNYRDGYRDGHRDSEMRRASLPHPDYPDRTPDYPERKMDNRTGFFRRHPVLTHLLLAIAAAFLLLWLALWFLDIWTFHGQERAVPNVKGQSFESAQTTIELAGLRAIVTDSIYDSYARPGTVVEQVPMPDSNIKKGGAVYLTVVSYTPKMVTIPDFYDVSERQARSMFEGLGITQLLITEVPSEYSGLVMGAKFNGVSLRPGARVPVTAVITLEVGRGMGDYTSDEAAPVDSLAIEQAIEAINID